MSECVCGKTFRTAEDYRDHLPCVVPKPAYEITTRYRYGSSDGYKRSHCGPLYKTFAAAKAEGIRKEGAYAVDPMPYECIELDDGRVFVIDGPHRTAEQVQSLEKTRKGALSKLSMEEKLALGLEKL